MGSDRSGRRESGVVACGAICLMGAHKSRIFLHAELLRYRRLLRCSVCANVLSDRGKQSYRAVSMIDIGI